MDIMKFFMGKGIKDNAFVKKFYGDRKLYWGESVIGKDDTYTPP
jgi:hypothetical protein